MKDAIVWSYGGGTQSAAMAVLVVEGALPRPDLIVMADTSREAAKTWEYKALHIDPYLASVGLTIEVAPHSLAAVDLFRGDTLLMPAFTETGKFTNFCSGEWKRDVVMRFCRQRGIESCVNWLGISFDERERMGKARKKWFQPAYPLVERRLTRQACYRIVEAAGLPEPPKSSCWCCPHRQNPQWRDLRDNYPEDFAKAVDLDKRIREHDLATGETGVYLHNSRVPLELADLGADKDDNPLFGCASGYCMT